MTFATQRLTVVPDTLASPGEFAARSPAHWLGDKPPEYPALYLIPADPEMCNLERFLAFVEVRRRLILDKFDCLLSKPGGAIRSSSGRS